MSVSTCPRTVFRNSVTEFPIIEGLTTMDTGKSTTLVTKESRTGAWLKFITANLAFFYRRTIWKATIYDQLRVTFPKLHLRLRVTRWTKSYKVFEFVRFHVIIKQVKRYFMVYRKPLTRYTATLTGIVVSIAYRLALPIPVFSPVICIAATPRRVISPRPSGRTTPGRPAFSTAKIMFLDLIGLLFYISPAGMTLNRNPFSPLSYPVNFLPFSITGETTKGIFGKFDMVLAPFDWLSALSAIDCGHTCIISQLENII